ncbi:MAG TPA: tRNA pseudouridine(38-40) synthase TruA [Candidatus Acidoferrales bacterium]|nr:tRNA pseudouridine(38-40) synthase TruA [Candidatus Acidoferrales bacterium]
MDRTLALVLEYDGTPYRGFQRQAGVASIQERVETALEMLFGQPTPVVAAGRTDAGVHATGQVISCSTTSELPLRRIAVAASAILRPSGIAVVRAVERAPGFSARRDALARTYRYEILNRVAPSPLLARRAFHVGAVLDLTAMARGGAHLVGEHDFAAFCASESRHKPTRRNLQVVELSRRGDSLDIRIHADSFLHNMVRIIVGTLVEVGRGRRPVEDVKATLQSQDRARAGFTAPAHGLYLEHVTYEDPV